MGFREFEITLPTDYSEEYLASRIKKVSGTAEFTYTILKKSLDARKKNNILWRLRVLVNAPSLKGAAPESSALDIPYKKRTQRVLVVGSGPSGFFAAYILQKAGFNVRLIERGLDVDERAAGIDDFEKGGSFKPDANYAFGEGGAGTFSDGKLTSRTKSIKKERGFIFDSYIKAGAPEEISCLAHPHLGTDNLKKIVKNLRADFKALGGEVIFGCELTDLVISGGKVCSAETTCGAMDFDYIFIAPGHSAFETYRMLIRRGVEFRNKNFAIGCRVEHPQRIINLAQWGHEAVPGLKAAEYRLTSQADSTHPVYTFCMCPGGTVVPATAAARSSVVNGMSMYGRNGDYANAACVAGVNIGQLTGRDCHPLETLDWLKKLERSFFEISNDYSVPAVSIKDFLEGKVAGSLKAVSFPLGAYSYPLWEMFPQSVVQALRLGLQDFARHVSGWEQGMIMGLESKTSAPIQAVRNSEGLAEGFSNLFITGEGSGWAGGIISSAADGIRAAMSLVCE